jgi:hypothetical protein
MATRGRPRHNGIHQVSYYTPKAELASKARQKVLEGRLKAAYDKLFVLAYHDEPNHIDKAFMNKIIKESLKLI